MHLKICINHKFWNLTSHLFIVWLFVNTSEYDLPSLRTGGGGVTKDTVQLPVQYIIYLITRSIPPIPYLVPQIYDIQQIQINV